MKRHPTASRLENRARTPKGGPPRGAVRPHPAFEKFSRAQSVSRTEPHLALAHARARTHTLIPTGELSHRTAHALEAEIERLCDEGVTAITLDLSRLTRIDSTGVAVVAFRSGLCDRRGFGFSILRGSDSVHRAFERAGLAEELPFAVAPELTPDAEASRGSYAR